MFPAKYFKRREFTCKCGCGFDTVDAELIAVLDAVREHFAAPVLINSGCRCEEYNSKIGGAKGSQHKFGRAADITVHGVTPGAVNAYLVGRFHDQYGIGNYQSFTHIDTRSQKARWNG